MTLTVPAAPTAPRPAPARTGERLVFVFPGQGSQEPGMGRALSWCPPEARAAIAEAEEHSGVPVDELMHRADAATLASPEVAQLVVLVHSVVQLRALLAEGARPAAVAGHSLGEYTALVAADALDWPDAVRLVAHRGAAMAEAAAARPGAMAALVGLDQETVIALCERRGGARAPVVVANVNSPRQVVVSGEAEAVDAVVADAGEAGALRAKRLPVGGAYHSPLMAPAEDTLAPLLRGAALRRPSVPVVSSVTGTPVEDVETYRARLVAQITAPVQWLRTAEALARHEADTHVEVGPGRVLTGLGREIDRRAVHRTAEKARRAVVPPTAAAPAVAIQESRT